MHAAPLCPPVHRVKLHAVVTLDGIPPVSKSNDSPGVIELTKSAMPSPSVSVLCVPSSGQTSMSSVTPSLSSSRSALSPMKSPSASESSVGSYGNASDVSGVPSLSSSRSALSPIPSPSASAVSLGSNG